MKIFFIGWNQNGEKCLQNLLKYGFIVAQIIVPTHFETERMFDIARKYKIPIQENNGDMNQLEKIVKKTNTTLLVVASFPKIVPIEILNLFTLGAINIHTGALPKYRGYHPLNWALIKDEKTMGVTVHYIDQGMDSGDILAQGLIRVKNSDTINSIKGKLTTLGAKLLIKVVRKIKRNGSKLVGLPQVEAEVIFAPKRSPEQGRISWKQNTRNIFNLIRSLHTPYPNAYAQRKNGERVFFERSFLSKNKGQVVGRIKDYFLITTDDGLIAVKTTTKLKIGEILA